MNMWNMTTQDVANAKRDTRSKKRFAFPYGEIWVDEHKSQTDLPFKFTGKELDPETGLYYYGARYYDARLSRWISADPALEKYMPKATDFDTEHDFYWYVQNDASGKLPGMGGVFNSLNLDMYAYAGMNPVKLTDPDGESTGDVMIENDDAERNPHTGTIIGITGLITLAVLTGNEPAAAYLGNRLAPIVGRAANVARNGPRVLQSLKGRFSMAGRVKAIINRLGGNPTVYKNGKPLFRFRASGHGFNKPNITEFTKNVTTKGEIFFNPKSKASQLTKKHFKIIKDALAGRGGYKIKTKGGR